MAIDFKEFENRKLDPKNNILDVNDYTKEEPKESSGFNDYSEEEIFADKSMKKQEKHITAMIPMPDEEDIGYTPKPRNKKKKQLATMIPEDIEILKKMEKLKR